MNRPARIRNAVFSMVTVLSLGFGAAQAFAAPRASAETAMEACTSLDVYRCNQSCKSRGYFAGTCEVLSNGYKYCNCF